MLDVLGTLTERPIDQRLAVTCRDFAVLPCSLPRTPGIPSRPRAGFADYFTPASTLDFLAPVSASDGPRHLYQRPPPRNPQPRVTPLRHRA